MKFIDENEWIKNKYYYGELDESKIKNIFYFTLLWNNFEKIYFQNDASISKVNKFVTDYAHTPNIEGLYDYFKKRYTQDNIINSIFNDFNFSVPKNKINTEDDYKKITKDILEDSNSEYKNKLKALLYIIFRLRNNLYHGIKKVEKLYEQNENFKYANQLLIKLIDKV